MNLQSVHVAGSDIQLLNVATNGRYDSSSTMERVSTDETRPSTSAGDSGVRGAERPKGDGGLRARLKNMLDTKAVPHEPALRFEGDWRSEVAARICRHWVASEKAHNGASISIVALSRMKALDYERKHRDSIPEEDRLLKGSPSKQDYYDAQSEAFLNAVGISGEKLEELTESFKLAGTGGLHRQHVTVAATISSLAGAAGQFLAAQHPAATAALYGTRLGLQVAVAERILDSGWRRLRNAGTEEVLPHGRADAAPSAKQAPTVFGASHAVIWELSGMQKNLRKMEGVMKALDDASAAYQASGTRADGDKVTNARGKLAIAFARICYQMEVKASYKASSESAKIEFRGNERYLATSYTGTTLTLGAGLFSILTPVLGVAGAPVTGGVSAGVAALVMLLYAGYQLSTGPSKDGEAKAKRAIVALSKSMDVLSGDKAAGREMRAAAYKEYLEERKAARLIAGRARTEFREAAKAKLVARLEEIAQQDEIEDLLDSKRNWQAYREHLENVLAIEGSAALEHWPPERIAGRKRELDNQFQDRHQAHFSTKTVADAWKNPMRIRMEIAGRLLKGKFAQSQKRLIDLNRHPVLKARFSKNNNDQAIASAKTELRNNLRDMINFELGLRHMCPLIDGDIDGSVAETPEIGRAAAAIGLIEDTDVHEVFCGDGKAQVEAANKAKKLIAGEAERYVLTNAGASLAGIGLNTAVGATDFGIAAAKASHAVHVGMDDPNPDGKPRIPKFSDYKFAAVSQAGAPLAAHMNAGNRAAFQKTQMPNVLNMTKREGDAIVELTMNVPSDIANLGEENDRVREMLATFVERLAKTDSIPDKLVLSRTPEGSDTSAPANIVIDLQPTSAYHRVQYENASQKTKLGVKWEQAGIVGRHALMSFAGFPAQGIAQYNLRKTRAPFERAMELEQQVRSTLSSDVMPSIVQEGDETDASHG